MESQLARADRKLAEMSKNAAKLHHFKQSVLDSFEADDYSDIKRKLTERSTSSRHSHQTADFTLDDQTSAGLQQQQQPRQSSSSHHKETEDILAQYPSFTSSIQSTANAGVPRPYSHSGNVNVKDALNGMMDSSSRKYSPATPTPMSSNAHSERSPYIAQQPIPQPSNNNNSNSNAQDTSTTSKVVDGRDFFKRAKATFSYDDFTHLLSQVKRYNERLQTRSTTLENVFASIGGKQQDMFKEFEKLLSK